MKKTNKMERKVFVVGNATYYSKFIYNSVLVDSIEEADIVLFTGGEDVDPSLYKTSNCGLSYSNLDRDMYEKEVFNSIPKDKLVVGVCRGSQFLCVMNGGKLVQDIGGHGLWGTHQIYSDVYDKQIDITSTHHQLQCPYNLDSKNYDILYYATNGYINEYLGVEKFKGRLGKLPEIVLYHKANMPKCLAIQGHPEMMDKDSGAVIEINNIINDLLK